MDKFDVSKSGKIISAQCDDGFSFFHLGSYVFVCTFGNREEFAQCGTVFGCQRVYFNVQQQFTKAIFKKKFRAEHSKELNAYAESVKYFREENDGKLPSLKSLKKRKEELTKEIAERKKAYAPLREESKRLEIASDNVYSIFRKTNEMKSDLAWKREWEANVREKARQEQARQEQRERQPKRKKRSYDMSL